MTEWHKYLLDCLSDIQAALDNPAYDDDAVRLALTMRQKQINAWLAEI